MVSRLAGIKEPHLDAELGEGLGEQGPRSAVQAAGGDEVLSRMHDRQQGRGDGRLAAGEHQPAAPPSSAASRFSSTSFVGFISRL